MSLPLDPFEISLNPYVKLPFLQKVVKCPKMASINAFLPWWPKAFFHKKGPASALQENLEG